jgi:phage-related protein
MEIKIKPLQWAGSSRKDIRNDSIFTPSARCEAGHQLFKVQKGDNPDNWKAFNEVGVGTKEIIIDVDNGWFRVMYVAKFEEAVYVLHCFKKKTNQTSQHDKELAEARYKELVQERKKHG